MGVVSFLITPFLRDIAVALQWSGAAATLEHPVTRLAIALAVLWAATGLNLLGVKAYERLMVPLMFLTFALGSVVIVAGFSYDHTDFVQALAARGDMAAALRFGVPDPWPVSALPWYRTLLPGAVLLFASFIGFDSIAQAGGEARRPGRDLPLAIFIAVGVVAVFYFLFTAAVYHTAPWPYVATEARHRDVTAPGLLGVVLPPFWTVVIVSSASVALVKDLPAMLLGVSRLMFAWAEDGIFPAAVAAVHPRFHTPYVAILLSAAMATIGILGCHLAGDWFLGVDILVTAMLINFVLMALSVLALPARNPALAAAIIVLPVPEAPGAGRSRRRGGAGAVPGGPHLERPDAAAPPGISSPRRCGRSSWRWPLWSTGGRCAGCAPAASTSRRASPPCRPNKPMLAIDRIDLAPELSISRVVTGLWQIADMERGGRTLDLDAAARAMQPYIDAGFTSFDMADHYGSAELIAGRARPHESEGGRHVQLFTKWVPPPGPVSADDVRAAVVRSLERLRVPAIDLLQFHAWNYADPAWLDALFHLRDLQREGLVRYLGLTNVDAAHLRLVLTSGIPIVANQVSASLVDRRASGALAAVCQEFDVSLLAYGTLCGGWLSDRWLGAAEPDWERISRSPHESEAGVTCSSSPSGATPGPVSADDVRAAVIRSLERLRVPAIDLLQFHAWNYADPAWLDALFHLRDLQREGLIRYLGPHQRRRRAPAPGADQRHPDRVEPGERVAHRPTRLRARSPPCARSSTCRCWPTARCAAAGSAIAGWERPSPTGNATGPGRR